MQLCLKPRGHVESNPRPSEEGVSFYLVLRPLDVCRFVSSQSQVLSVTVIAVAFVVPLLKFLTMFQALF